MIRMSEASARMQLRENVRSDDVDLAIRVMLNSFINAQKYSVMKQMKKVSANHRAKGDIMTNETDNSPPFFSPCRRSPST